MNTFYIDIPQQSTIGAFGVIFEPENIGEMFMCRSGLQINPISDNPIDEIICERCNVDLYSYSQVLSDYQIYAVPLIKVFDTDSFGGHFAKVSGSPQPVNNLNDEYAPIAYIQQDKRTHIIAENIQDFLSLAFFYPEWRVVLDGGVAYFKDLGMGEIIPDIQKDDQAIEKLEKCLTMESPQLFSSLKEAKEKFSIYTIAELMKVLDIASLLV